MDLSELETIAGQLLDQERRLREVEEELKHLEVELREQPRRSEREQRFYQLIGLHWKESGELKQREQELRREGERIRQLIQQYRARIMKGVSSGQFIIPLDPKPQRTESGYFFTYRSDLTYPKSIEALAQLVGLPAPIRIGDVVIAPDRVSVEDQDPYSAMEKIVEAFEKIRKTVALKLSTKR